MKHNTAIGTLREMVHGASTLLTRSLLLLALAALGLPERSFGVGSWTAVSTQPSDGIGLLMLLSDGTVLAEGANSDWFSLAPDSTGHYIHGNWSARNSSTYGHQTGSSAVLTNGTVYMGGGENGTGINSVEIYNPVSGLWSTAVNSAYFGGISDGNAMLLYNGEVLIEPQHLSSGYSGTFLFNPGNNTLPATVGSPLNGIAESAWVKLPNDNVLVIDSGNSSSGATTAEYYNPYTGYWYNAVAGGTVPNIWPNVTGTGDVSEAGPAFMLPNGNAIFFGGNLVTAIYNNGTWSQGTSLNNGEGMKDAPGAMMVNGKILLAVSPQGINSSVGAINGIGPTSFYEYDYTANSGAGSFTLAPNPPGNPVSGRAQGVTLLDLPDGTVLMSYGSSQLYVYQPDGSPLALGQPAINNVQWDADGSLLLTGTLFNGISAGAAFGDEGQMDSNFPLVRFTAGSTAYYGYTYNWSSTSVQAYGRTVTTKVTLPAAVLDAPGSTWTMQVVANGIGSPGWSFNTGDWVNFSYYSFWGFYFGTYPLPYNTLASAVANVPSGGTINIDSSSTVSSETMTITKPMNIISVGGPSTIGVR